MLSSRPINNTPKTLIEIYNSITNIPLRQNTITKRIKKNKYKLQSYVNLYGIKNIIKKKHQIK